MYKLLFVQRNTRRKIFGQLKTDRNECWRLEIVKKCDFHKNIHFQMTISLKQVDQIQFNDRSFEAVKTTLQIVIQKTLNNRRLLTHSLRQPKFEDSGPV